MSASRRRTAPRSYSTAPDWSPDGRYIAFEQQNHLFQVWLLDRTTHRKRELTSTGENEDPTWAPDARHLAITSDRNGARAIWILDVPTGRMRQLTSRQWRPSSRLVASNSRPLIGHETLHV